MSFPWHRPVDKFHAVSSIFVKHGAMNTFEASDPVEIPVILLRDGEALPTTLVLEVIRERHEYWATVLPSEVAMGPRFALDIASMRRLGAAWGRIDRQLHPDGDGHER